MTYLTESQLQSEAEIHSPDRNIERLTTLRDFLRTVPQANFDMTEWSKGTPHERRAHKCGTAACIGGWACTLFFPEDDHVGSHRIAKWLGLSDVDRERLFFWHGVSYKATLSEAVNTLTKFIETGIVDWSASRKRWHADRGMNENGELLPAEA